MPSRSLLWSGSMLAVFAALALGGAYLAVPDFFRGAGYVSMYFAIVGESPSGCFDYGRWDIRRAGRCVAAFEKIEGAGCGVAEDDGLWRGGRCEGRNVVAFGCFQEWGNGAEETERFSQAAADGGLSSVS